MTGAKVVRWQTPEGKEGERRFETGHTDRERREFLESLLRDPKRIAPGTSVTVEEVKGRKRK